MRSLVWSASVTECATNSAACATWRPISAIEEIICSAALAAAVMLAEASFEVVTAEPVRSDVACEEFDSTVAITFSDAVLSPTVCSSAVPLRTRLLGLAPLYPVRTVPVGSLYTPLTRLPPANVAGDIENVRLAEPGAFCQTA